MVLDAHGIVIDLPEGWEGRIYRRPGGDPTLHAATFALPAHDADFGTRATARMRPGDAFLALTEYRTGRGLEPGRGLFASKELPLPLHGRHFNPSSLLVARRGQSGFQHFFTDRGRPFCLYAVVSRPRGTHARTATPPQLAALNRVLGSVEVKAGR